MIKYYLIIILITIVLYYTYICTKYTYRLQHFNTTNDQNKECIAFLFSGQSRSFPFSNSENASTNILESYNKLLFTDEFKSKYNYKIYISTDDLNLTKTISYFSPEHIGNIHLLDTNYYFKEPVDKTEDISIYLDNYNNHFSEKEKKEEKEAKYINSIHQHYKILDCYNLYKNDDQDCKYIIRLRLDTVFTINLLDLIYIFTQSEKTQIVMDWDFFAIGTPLIMKCYCTGLDNNYGKYNYNTHLQYNTPPIMLDYNKNDKNRWAYAPERQLFEMLFEYCNIKNLDIRDAIKTVKLCDKA